MRISFRPSRYNAGFVQNEFAPVFRTCAEAFGILTAIFIAVACIKPDLLLGFFTGNILAFFSDTASVEPLHNGEIFSLLFTGNVQALAVAAVYGLIPFFYSAALVLGLNSLSIVSAGVYFIHNGGSLAAYLAGILPHGIFEIPALLYACAIGICHCRLTTRAILGREQPAPWRDQIVSLSMVFVSVIIPMLLISALIETFLTPAVMGLFM